jgi:hypothetical protein
MDIEQQPKPALPLLALLALASALGIAVAVALAAVAMLLAAPAYADEGSLLLERGAGLAKARLLFTQSESEEEGHLRLAEAYHNPFDEPVSGVYLFRLPQNAVVERTAPIGAGETLRVELEYRARAPRRRVLAGCC